MIGAERVQGWVLAAFRGLSMRRVLFLKGGGKGFRGLPCFFLKGFGVFRALGLSAT